MVVVDVSKQRLQAVFAEVLDRAVADGLVAVALVHSHRRVVGLAGALTEDEAMPIAAFVLHRHRGPGLTARLFSGEVVELALEDGREIAVGIASRKLFVVAVLGGWAGVERVRELRDQLEQMIDEASRSDDQSPLGGGGSGGGGPADLPLIELGITVSRNRGQA